MTDVIRIVGERKLVKSDSTTETSSKTIQDTTETWETTKKGKGCKKVEIPLGGKVDAPTDDGISTPKTEEQLENLAKLAQAREFMKTEDGKKLAQSLLEQDMEISKGQKKWLKKNGIDPEAFIRNGTKPIRNRKIINSALQVLPKAQKRKWAPSQIRIWA